MADDYVMVSSDLHGTMVKEGKEVTVPFFVYKRKSDGKHCRIPQEAYRHLQQLGMQKHNILLDHAQWYEEIRKDDLKKERQRKRHHIRNLFDLLVYLETGVSDKQYEKMVKAVNAFWKKHHKIPTLKQFRMIFPPMLEMVIVARAAADVAEKQDPTRSLEKYCKLLIGEKE